MKTTLTGLRYEPHIPHGSGDAEYRLINKHGQAVALIDPEMVMDDAADVAESIVLAVGSGMRADPISSLHDRAPWCGRGCNRANSRNRAAPTKGV